MTAEQRARPIRGKKLFQNDHKEWQKTVRHKVPVLLEVGRPAPKCVLSFGGAGFLVTYSLGVALYLQKERPKLLAESYLLGAGSGVFPAVALACGPQAMDIEKMRDEVIKRPFGVWHNEHRLRHIREVCEKYLPDDVAKRMNGRCCISLGMSPMDSGFYQQEPAQQLYGALVPTFDNKEDVTNLILATTAPNKNEPHTFRGMPAMRSTLSSISSELDQFVRHIYIHGIGGGKTKQYKRHRHIFGRHGTLANCNQWPIRQMQLASYPYFGANEALRQAFDDGYHDARRYERWEEDPYHFAKADRSPSEDRDWRELRAAFNGEKRDYF